MAEKLVFDKATNKVTSDVSKAPPKFATVVEDTPPPNTNVAEEPHVIIYDRDKLYAPKPAEAPRVPRISAQTKLEMEAGVASLKRLYGE